jgi:NAD(P)-dependent dehydrogenase (short-subunit alcohol dehydrogenase family)
MKKPVCVVVGVGPGNGAALARRFAAGGYLLLDFHSGATEMPGSFTEGLFLRRSQGVLALEIPKQGRA